jgi:3',5'-cyclic-AMP phosphodiesterase
VLLAQLSDTHLLADPDALLWDVNTTRSLASVVDALPVGVDVMVVTGDVSEDGTPEAYQRALALTEGRAEQRYFVAGNHDDPEVLRAVLGPAPPVRMIPIGERWSMALVDSQWVGHEDGRVADAALSQLRDELARAQTHVVVCLHHPPISTCDNPACGLTDNEAFLEVIRNSRVRLVLSGHLHHQFDTTRDGIRFIGAPSTFRQLRHGGDPHYTDTGEPPAAQLVELLDDGDVSCQVVRAG